MAEKPSTEPMPARLTTPCPAPDFCLPAVTREGVEQRCLTDYAGQWLLLYMYPKDSTPGCTTQACDFRDSYAELDAALLGVSGDDVASHQAFIAEQQLPFPLLVDDGHALAKRYGAYGVRTLYGKQVTGMLRSSFIINPEGTLVKAMYNVRAKGHVARLRQALAELKG